MYSFLDLVKKVDVAPYPHEVTEYNTFFKSLYNFYSHDGRFQLGYLLPIVVDKMRLNESIFSVDDTKNIVKLQPGLHTLEMRSAALNNLAENWKLNNVFDTLNGWRNELYTIYSPAGEAYMRLERALCPLLGVVMYGVHINGYVVTSANELKIWVPRRAKNKPTYPGMLDNTVAGGLGHPYGCLDTCLKECYEEAGLDEEYVKKNIKSVGSVSYLYQMHKNEWNNEKGLVQPEVEYVYDLKISENIIPHPVDHEAEDFRLMSVDETIDRLKNGEFKHNCAGIIIDFLIRFGIITPETEKDFIEINSRLHRMLPFPVRRG